VLKYFGFSSLVTIVAVLAVWATLGLPAALTTIVLVAIEIALSFDNAIINAKVLGRMSRFWQQLFLTLGIVIAIVGMRLIFPILIVMISAHLPWGEVIKEALHHPATYSRHLSAARISIAAFGGSFLLTLTLYFLFDDARQELWLTHLERQLQRAGGTRWLPPLLVAALVGGLSLLAGANSGQVLRLGLIGTAAYTMLKLLIDGLGKLETDKHKVYLGWSAVLAFLYLELLDASFSFDGVLGAFAITDKVVLIAIGLGVGAVWVRSLTVFMVQRGTLSAYKYLEHGAHYAILVLAAALLGSIFLNVPDAITGIIGLGVIIASFIASRQDIQAHQSP